MDILLNGQVVDELCTVVHSSRASEKAKKMCAKLLDIVPRQQFLTAMWTLELHIASDYIQFLIS